MDRLGSNQTSASTRMMPFFPTIRKWAVISSKLDPMVIRRQSHHWHSLTRFVTLLATQVRNDHGRGKRGETGFFQNDFSYGAQGSQGTHVQDVLRFLIQTTYESMRRLGRGNVEKTNDIPHGTPISPTDDNSPDLFQCKSSITYIRPVSCSLAWVVIMDGKRGGLETQLACRIDPLCRVLTWLGCPLTCVTARVSPVRLRINLA